MNFFPSTRDSIVCMLALSAQKIWSRFYLDVITTSYINELGMTLAIYVYYDRSFFLLFFFLQILFPRQWIMERGKKKERKDSEAIIVLYAELEANRMSVDDCEQH